MADTLAPKAGRGSSSSKASTSTTLVVNGQLLSLRVVSLLFGMLVAGSVLLSCSAFSYLSTHTSSTSSSSSSKLSEQEKGNTTAAYRTWQEGLNGIFVLAWPLWIGSKAHSLTEMVGGGVRTTGIVVAVVGLVVGSSVVGVLWERGDR